jgi:transcriptional regulator with XRE-family HTH domain
MPMSRILEALAELLGDKEPIPNKFTIGLGELARTARVEAGLSQAELAKLVYRRRSTISDLENGKSKVGITTLSLISVALDKPITYFIPPNIRVKLKPDDLDTEELELIMQFRKIADEQLRLLSIRQVKLLADTDIENYKEALREEVAKLPHRS